MEHKRNIAKVLLVLWIVFITVISLATFSKISQIKIQNGDKYVHFTLYFVLTFLLYHSRLLSLNLSKKIKLMICLGISCAYGIIIEVVQGFFTVNRQFEWIDILANSMGSLLAVLFLYKISDKNFFFK